MTTLRGKAITLREFSGEDVDAAYAIIGDDRVTYWLSFDSRTRDAAADMVSGAIKRAREEPRVEYYLAISKVQDEALIGFARLALTGVEAAKLGYAIRADEWGKGYASEAVSLMLAFGFTTLGLNRVTAAIGPDNSRSISLVEKNGFKYEGTLREHVFTNGSWRDSLLYSVLVSDWSPS